MVIVFMKKGISAIVAIVLMILIVIVGIGIIWGVVLPFLNQDVELSDSAVTVDTDGGYTFYDEATEIACVQITRNEEVIDGVKIIFVITGESYPLTINSSDLPEPNGQKRYCVNLSSFGDSPSGNLVPIVGGSSGGGSPFDIIVRPFAPKALESLTSGGGKIYRVDGDPDIPATVITFMKTFGGENYDWGDSGQQASDDGYVFTGFFSYWEDGIKPFLLKTNSAGDEEWNTTFGDATTSQNRLNSVQNTSDGGYIIAGIKADSGSSAGWLIKTNSTGDEEWSRVFGENVYYAHFNSVQQTSDGGYILAGLRGTRGDGWFLKTNSTGHEEWNKTFDYGFFNSVQQTSDGGYILSGYDGFRSSDGRVVKTNSTGHEEWNVKVSDILGVTSIVFSVIQAEDGMFVVVGRTANGAVLIKLNSSGDKIWNTAFGDSNKYSSFFSVQQTSDGGYILAGDGNEGDDWVDNKNGLLLKTNSTGHEEWSATFGDIDGNDIFRFVQQTSDGGYILVGTTSTYGVGGSSDAWLIKTNSTGDVV